METTVVDLDAPGGELLGACAFLAVLAYPESHPRRDRAVAAMLALLNRAARLHQRPTSSFASELFTAVPAKRQAQILGTGQKGTLPRVRRRLDAAAAAATILSQKVSVNSIAETYEGDASHFLHAVWAESKPVLHLALALRGTLYRLRDDRPAYIQLLADPSWVRAALHSAESWRTMLSLQALPLELSSEAFVRLVPLNCSDLPTTP